MQVRAELAPWDKQIGEVNSRIGIATAERDALAKRAEDARRRLDGALKGLAAAQQSAAAKAKQIQELEAAATRCRCVSSLRPRRWAGGVLQCCCGFAGARGPAEAPLFRQRVELLAPRTPIGFLIRSLRDSGRSLLTLDPSPTPPAGSRLTSTRRTSSGSVRCFRFRRVAAA
jgi:hypothetical protein